ncbi:type I phosphomannose isomerase catalytic subunit [Deinococcus hopiensis]|uniref:Mannose-6-phosphate isomerase n=1 Tax=Deinococcus hopiensis KR-140 TaxID=695939 RepID=A0A1W1UGB1_9DEIO|nr:type I phosphomannose isomerase catalytic subunit [Deinococcus hopiensis]SMB80126.1 mannose-6-phosphate isomerase [Deinococcus hopiensis KR-140]
MTALPFRHLYRLEPQYRERVWGGQNLRPGQPPVGEAWIAYEGSRVEGEEDHTVGELAAERGAALLGRAVARRSLRFPLLIKLLDCADWLSVQVHPNDEQAARLVGPGEYGKTEAWHFLEVEPGASILAGVKPGTTRNALARAIREGQVLDVGLRREVQPGETVFIPAGTLHALGPGTLLYEVQQVSDTTYRVYDWDRPASAGRSLHIEESVEVTDPAQVPEVTPPPTFSGTAAQETVRCPFFALEVLQLGGEALTGDTLGQSAHVVTATGGEIEVRCGEESVRLGRFESVLIAGEAGRYEVRSTGGETRALRASVPEDVGDDDGQQG